MAALIESIAVSGSRKSDGSANAAGKVWVLQPGSTNKTAQVAAYSDADGVSAQTQPFVLDGAGRSAIYVKAAFSLLVEDSAGNTVRSAARAGAANASQVEVENAGYLGTVLSGLTKGSTAAGGRTDLNSILTNLYLTLGGHDAKLLVANGGTERKVKDHLFEIEVSVKDWGAKGDNNADDTTAIQAALNHVASSSYGAYAGTVSFPPGIYRVSDTVAIPGNVKLRGHGGVTSRSIIRSTSGSAGVFSIAGYAVTLEGIYIDATSGNTGTGIAATGSAIVLMRDVVVSSDFYRGYKDASGCTTTALFCSFSGNSSGTAALDVIGNGVWDQCGVAGPVGVQLDGAARQRFTGCIISGSNGSAVKGLSTWRSGAALAVCDVVGCAVAGSTYYFEILNVTAATGVRWSDVGCVENGLVLPASGNYNIPTTSPGFTTDSRFGLGRDGDRQGTDTAAAATLNLPYDGNLIKVAAGGAAVDYIATNGFHAGSVIRIMSAAGATVLNHNTGAGTAAARPLILKKGAAYTPATGVITTFVYTGTTFQELFQSF